MGNCHTGPDLRPDPRDNTALSCMTCGGNVQRSGMLAWQPRQADGDGTMTSRRGDGDNGVTSTEDETADVDV